MSNLINITNIEWDTDEEMNDLPNSIIVNVSDEDYLRIKDGDDDLLVDMVSDFYNFCINHLEYTFDIPAGEFLPDVDLDNE